jgi:hypothetical protein
MNRGIGPGVGMYGTNERKIRGAVSIKNNQTDSVRTHRNKRDRTSDVLDPVDFISTWTETRLN